MAETPKAKEPSIGEANHDVGTGVVVESFATACIQVITQMVVIIVSTLCKE
jgi:hypothetical protein